MIYLSRVGTVVEYERTQIEHAERAPNPNLRSGVEPFQTLWKRENLTVRLHPRGRTMPDFWVTEEAVSFLRKVWRIHSVEAPEARGDGIALTIHLWRDFAPPAIAKRKDKE